MNSETKVLGKRALAKLLYITIGTGTILLGGYFFSKAQEKKGIEERLTRLEELLELSLKKENTE